MRIQDRWDTEKEDAIFIETEDKKEIIILPNGEIINDISQTITKARQE